MSKTDKDTPRDKARRTKWWISTKGFSAFARQCRRSARAKARQDMRNGREPQPRYRDEREYWD